MISELIALLDTAAKERLPAPARHGLCELHSTDSGTIPVEFAGGGSFNNVATDVTGGFSYWRLGGAIGETRDNRFKACNDATTMAIPLRLVTVLDRELCASVEDASRAAATAMRRAEKTIATGLGAFLAEIEVTAVNADTGRVWQEEFGGTLDQSSRAAVAIELRVSITGKAVCFDPCDPVDLICAMIAAATNEKVVECLGPVRVAEICEGGGPCLDATVDNSDGSFTQAIPAGDTYTLDDYDFVFQDPNGVVTSTEVRPAMVGETFIIGCCPTTFLFNLNINGVFSQVVTVDTASDINITL